MTDGDAMDLTLCMTCAGGSGEGAIDIIDDEVFGPICAECRAYIGGEDD